MTDIDGGIIQKAFPFPRGDGATYALVGIWSGGNLAPADKPVLQHFRNRQVLGQTRLIGTEINNAVSRDVILIVSKPQVPFEPGDILIFGDGYYSEIQIVEFTPVVPPNSAILFTFQQFHAIAIGKDKVDKLIVFHKKSALISRDPSQSLHWRGTMFACKIQLPVSADDPITLHFPAEAVSASKLLEALGYVQNFVLDAGHDLLHGIGQDPAPKKTRSVFDPQVSAQAASLKLIISPPRADVIPLAVAPSEPLHILVSALSAASVGDTGGLMQIMLSKFSSVDDLLKDLRRIANISVKFGGFLVGYSDPASEFKVSDTTLSSIQSSIRARPLRQVRKDGSLFAVELKRYWCKLAVGNDHEEQWTLKYAVEIRDKIEGLIPRSVTVLFETRDKPDCARGVGRILSIRDI